MFFIAAAGCGQNQYKNPPKYSQSKELMATYFQIDTCLQDMKGKNKEQIYGRVWKRLEEIAWRMNLFDEKSDVAKVNRSYPQAVQIEADTYQLIKNSLEFTLITRGAFDITIGPLINLWKKAQELDEAPSEGDVRRIKEAIGPGTVQLLTDNMIVLRHPLTKIDLGGIGKGYALDEAARIFREEGLERFYIDAGGQILVRGQNCKGELWQIGIRNPTDNSKIMDVIQITNASVSTSGNYQQYYMIKGNKLSHIINPITGYPQQGVNSASVIAPTGTEADALSTAMTVLGHQEGVNLINQMGPSYAALIVELEKDNLVKYSSQNYEQLRVPQK